MAANKIIIMQAANTGLTGGSTPDGDDYNREIVIVSTLRMAKVHLIDEGRQVICLPGATLFQLEKALRPLKREPHSVIGSSCIGASVFGGVCNNSGGALIHRGPAFTQMALFARMDEVGEIQLVNHLGVKLGNDPETILKRLDQGDFKATDIEYSLGRVASDHGYADHVRDALAAIEADIDSWEDARVVSADEALVVVGIGKALRRDRTDRPAEYLNVDPTGMTEAGNGPYQIGALSQCDAAHRDGDVAMRNAVPP